MFHSGLELEAEYCDGDVAVSFEYTFQEWIRVEKAEVDSITSLSLACLSPLPSF